MRAIWVARAARGFYDYGEGALKPEANEDEGLGREIVERIVLMLMNEAADALYLGVASAADLDLAMTKGVNYPKGLLAWANEWGIEQVVEGMDRLQSLYLEDRYRCSPLLRRLARDGEQFTGL